VEHKNKDVDFLHHLLWWITNPWCWCDAKGYGVACRLDEHAQRCGIRDTRASVSDKAVSIYDSMSMWFGAHS
jgi:hypothetical protein